MSVASITSHGVNFTSAPASSNLRHLVAVRFQTQTLCPEFNKFLTMPLPMIPRPRKPKVNDDGLIFFDLSVVETFPTSISGASGFTTDDGLFSNCVTDIFLRVGVKLLRDKSGLEDLVSFRSRLRFTTGDFAPDFDSVCFALFVS